MPRPTKFSSALARDICLRLMEGESLRTICRGDDMPVRSTVHLWLAERREFSDQYARAREVQADTIFDEVLDIADTQELGETVTEKPVMVDGKPLAGVAVREVKTEDMLGHRRLRIDARKWMAGKLRPKKYGEKVDVDLSGAVRVSGALEWQPPQ